MTLSLLMGPMEIGTSPDAGREGRLTVTLTVTQKIYGLQIAEDEAIALDGTIFDPRTLQAL